MSTDSNSTLSEYLGRSDDNKTKGEDNQSSETHPIEDHFYTDTPDQPGENSNLTPIFESPPNNYPSDQIASCGSTTLSSNLCISQSDSTQAEYTKIGGSGGFGSDRDIEQRNKTYDILTKLMGAPVVRSGGGSLSMQPNYTFGLLTDIEKTENSIRVEIEELCHTKNRSTRDDPRSVTLGSWMISVPTTPSDYAAAAKALTRYDSGVTDFLLPAKRSTHTKTENLIQKFKSLSIADKISIPQYKTQLEIISDHFETHAITRRGTLSEKVKSVTSIVVSNPNGGFYQIGLHIPSREPFEEIPSCSISGSCSTPPTPNTAFYTDGGFSLDELTTTEIPHPPDPTKIEPDEEVQNSPLPEPKLQSSPEEVEFIGEKTNRKIHQVSDIYLSTEQIAFELFGSGDKLSEEERTELLDIINNLPRSTDIKHNLKAEANKFED